MGGGALSEPRRVLVVDDDGEIRGLTSTVLSSAGYQVTAAASGRDALRLARETRFDLCLLDINMPEMDGWQTLKLLRADDDLRELPVVMFSVKSEFRDRIQGIQEGASDYIVKPFGVDELVARVRRVLDSAGRGGRDQPVPVR
jgi:DNA-binding response OmpR family regulator